MLNRKYITCIFVFSMLVAVSTAQPPTKRLKISSNHRYFTDERGKPFFWLGDTGWLLFSKLDREEAEKYLEDRKEKGFNVIQVMLVHSLSLVNIYGDSALRDHNIATPLVTEGNSFSDPKQYDYWDHVDYIVNLAASKNLYMALVPVWGTNVKAGNVSREQARAYATFLAKRFSNHWNVIWLNGGDTRGSDSLATWNIFGSTLRQNDKRHLISYHPFGRTSSSEWFHNESWLDFDMFQSGHRSYEEDTARNEHRFGPDNYKFVNIDRNLKPTKPTLDGEPSYELIPHALHDTTKPYWQAQDVRRYAYWSVFAGAAGHTYGHNSVMQMHKPTDKGSAYGSKKFWFDALNDSGASQMKYLKELILSQSYFDRVPDQSMIVDQGERYDYIAATRGKDFAFIYDYTGRNFKLNMGKIGGSMVAAFWYDPKNGNKISSGVMKNNGIEEFDPPGVPGEGNDWVLVLISLELKI